MKNKPFCCTTERKWYKEPILVVSLFIVLVIASNSVLSVSGINVLNPAIEKFWLYVSQTWWAVLLGIIIGALIDIFVPQALMVRFLNKGKKSIVIAVILGFLASACSHGILAIAVSLFKKGASTASTLAFLLAAPWANIAITVLLFSLFGLKAFFIVFGAIIIAIISGLIFQILEAKGLIESNGNLSSKETEQIVWQWHGFGKSLNLFFKSSLALSKMILFWVLLGFILASVFGAYMPDNIMQTYFGSNLLGLIVTLAFATVLEICSEGTAPMAFELFRKTGSFGNSFVFLQAGVVTDFTEIGIIYSNIGRRAALAMILTGVPLVIAAGILLNLFIK